MSFATKQHKLWNVNVIICIKTAQFALKQHYLHKKLTICIKAAQILSVFLKKCLLEPKCLIALLSCYTTLMMSAKPPHPTPPHPPINQSQPNSHPGHINSKGFWEITIIFINLISWPGDLLNKLLVISWVKFNFTQNWPLRCTGGWFEGRAVEKFSDAGN